MLSALPSFILMPLAFTLLCLNLAVLGTMIFLGGLFMLILPFKIVRTFLHGPTHAFYRGWAFNNIFVVNLVNKVDWQITGLENLDRKSWYLIIANHQSWLDIFLLSDLCRNRIPEAKYFLKETLKKVPFIGMACWALDMPFMKRYSREFIEKNPHLKGKDIETTKKSCKSFEKNPTTIINFVEGSRITPEKHKKQNSPFVNLLPPKAGGIAFTLAALGSQFDKVLNVTIVYPDNPGHVMKDMLKGNLKRVVLHVEQLSVDENLIGDYFNDEQFKIDFQQWLNDKWQEKDEFINTTLQK